MRRTIMVVISTLHLARADRDEIDRLISTSPRNIGGRIEVQHDELVIEPHQYGFFVQTGIAGCGAAKCLNISSSLWSLLRAAHDAGADWINFDRDEPLAAGLPTFDDEDEGAGAGAGAGAQGGGSPCL